MDSLQTGKIVKSNLAEIKSSPLDKVYDSGTTDSAPIELVKVSQSFDQATGILQTIISEQLSDKVIKKLPPDEYLQLMSLVDKMMTGSIDNKV